MKKTIVIIILVFAASCLFGQADIEFQYEEALTDKQVQSVTEIKSLGEIWVGTYKGISRYDGNSWTQETDLGGPVNPNAYQIIEATDGKVWVALGGDGVSVYDGLGWTNYTVADGLASNTNWAIAQDSSGNIWVGSTNAGVSVYDGSSWQVYDVNDGLTGNSVVEILPLHSGEVWLGTANGANIWDGSSFRNITTNEGLPSNLVRSLYQDFNGNIMVGTSSGIGIFNKAEWTYLNTDNGLPTNNILHISQMKNGDFLFSTDEGLIHYDGTVFSTLTYENGLSEDIIKSSFVDSDNRIWLATPHSGVSVCDTENAFYNVRTNHHLADSTINTLHHYDGVLWIGTNHGANEYTGEYWRTFKIVPGIDCIAGNKVVDINKEADTVCFATYTGLTKYYNQTFVNYTSVNGLVNDTVIAVEMMADGTIYVGTNYGLMEILTDGSMDTITMTDGLVNDSVNDLLEDGSGNLWISTQQGISVYDGSTFTNYDSNDLGGTVVDGLFEDADGTWAGTDSTLAVFDGTSWTTYSHTYPGETITDIVTMNPGVSLSLLYANGNIDSFVKSSASFNGSSYSNKTAIANFHNTYYFMGSTTGLIGVDLSVESDNTFSLTDPTCLNTANGSISIVENTDNPPYQYSIDNGRTWQGTAVFNSLPYGQYHLKVENNLGEFTLDTTVFLNPQNEMYAVLGIDQIDCNGQNNGVIELFMDDPSYIYMWSDSGSGLLRENLNSGTYSVTVDDGTCSLTRNNTIIEPDAIALSAVTTDIECYGDSTGTIDLTMSGGTPPLEIMWSNGAETEDLTDLPAGDYTVTVTDANGCFEELTETISQPAQALSVTETIVDVDCYGDTDGEIDITISGGTPIYYIEWDTGDVSEDLTGLSPGDYTVTVTDANGCSLSESYNLVSPPVFEFTAIDPEDVLCHGDTTGSITAGATGGTGTLSYEWTLAGEPGVYSTNPSIDNLGVGDYTLVVTDDNSCMIDTTISIEEPDPLTMSFDVTPITCQGYNDGSIAAIPQGGTQPYIEYLWTFEGNIVDVDSIITGCEPGWYYIDVTDAHYCEISDSVEITDPEAHTIEINVTDMPCHGAEEGEIEVVVDGGTATGLSYQWSNGAGDTPVATNLGPGEYFVTITDSFGCEMYESAIVEEPALQDLGAFDSGVAWLCSGESTTLDAGSGYASYLWNTGETTQTIDVNSENVYHVFVVDTDDCEYGDTVEVMLSYPYEDDDICLATVNDDNHVELIWNKTENVGTSEYNIYKENPVTSGFELLATVPFTNPGIYVDTSSNAELHDENYKISVVDTCGNESSLGDLHSNISLNVNEDEFGACYLDWDSYEGYFVVYYFIRRGTSPSNMEVVDSVLYNDFDYAEMNPDPEGVYYQIMVRKPDPCEPGDGNSYNYAYSNTVYCDNLTGIPGIAYGNLDVYPNPFNNIINIDAYLKIESDIIIRLWNTMGQKVFEKNIGHLTAGKHHFVLSELSDSILVPGLYNIQIHFGDDIYQQQILKY
ncbi:MAG: two-component regulator propeller domain-containing protein [Bacteroidales bacterium]